MRLKFVSYHINTLVFFSFVEIFNFEQLRKLGRGFTGLIGDQWFPSLKTKVQNQRYQISSWCQKNLLNDVFEKYLFLLTRQSLVALKLHWKSTIYEEQSCNRVTSLSEIKSCQHYENSRKTQNLGRRYSCLPSKPLMYILFFRINH